MVKQDVSQELKCDMESLMYINNLHSSRESEQEGKIKRQTNMQDEAWLLFFQAHFPLQVCEILQTYFFESWSTTQKCHSSCSTKGEGKWLPLELARVSLEVLLSSLKHEGLSSKE